MRKQTPKKRQIRVFLYDRKTDCYYLNPLLVFDKEKNDYVLRPEAASDLLQ